MSNRPILVTGATFQMRALSVEDYRQGKIADNPLPWPTLLPLTPTRWFLEAVTR